LIRIRNLIRNRHFTLYKKFNFYFYHYQPINCYFDNSIYVLKEKLVRLIYSNYFHLLSLMNCVLALKWLAALRKRIYRRGIFISTSCYNTMLLILKQRYAISILKQEQRERDILAYFLFCYVFLRFYIIEIYLHVVFLHDIL
jgi:hypothetical protein